MGRKGTKITDPEGREFSSIRELANFYGVNDITLRARLTRGLTLREAIIRPERYKGMIDHAGIEHANQTEMLKYYGVALKTYHYRRKQGCTLEQALTMPKYSSTPNPNKKKPGRKPRSAQGFKMPKISDLDRFLYMRW